MSQLIAGISGAAHGTAAAQVTNGILQPGMENFVGTQSPASGAPKAYLNWVLLDEEQFKMAGGGVTPVPKLTGTQQKQLLQANGGSAIEMTKNGYLYVYVSNASRGNVYFDDIRVEHIRGSLIEETHYYPFGLTMAGISSKALSFGAPENKKKYNGIEKEDGLGIEIYDAQLRELDPQIGRWWEIDPKIESMEMWSPYASNYDNPIRYSDPLGDESGDCCGFLSNAWVTQKRGWYVVGKWVKETASQAWENAKGNWKAGHDPVHQAMANPMSTLLGPAGAELTAVETLVNTELKVGATEVRVLESTKNAVQKYEVGAYNELKAKSVVGDDLQIHHVPQKQPANNVVEGYNKNTAPSIAITTEEHQAIPTLKGTQTASSNGITTPQRAQLAKDIRDLRTYTQAPNSSLQQLIDLTKKQFQGQFDKPPRIKNN